MLAGQVLLRRRPVGQCLRLGSQGRCELPAGRSPTHLGFDLFHDRWPTGARSQAARWLALLGRLLLQRRSLFACWTCLAEPQFVPRSSPSPDACYRRDAQLQSATTTPAEISRRRVVNFSGKASPEAISSPDEAFGQNRHRFAPQTTGLVLRARITGSPGIDQGDVLVWQFAVALPELLWRPAFDRVPHAKSPHSSDCRSGIGAMLRRHSSSLFLDLRHRRWAMSNPLPPQLMSPAERLDEVARLLALGYPPAARSAPGGKSQ